MSVKEVVCGCEGVGVGVAESPWPGRPAPLVVGRYCVLCPAVVPIVLLPPA